MKKNVDRIYKAEKRYWTLKEEANNMNKWRLKFAEQVNPSAC